MVKCFRCLPTYKGSSVICRSYGTNCDLLLHSVRQDSARAGVQTEPGLVMDESFCLLWPHDDCLFLQDIRENDLGHAAARPHLLAQRSTVCCSGCVWEWHIVILLKVHLPPRPLLCTGDFKIKEAIHHLQHVMLRPYRERKREGKWRARGAGAAFSS